MKIHTIYPTKQPYLQMLGEIAKPPEKLYISGILPEKRITSVAIVGSRKPTPYGQEVAQKLSYELAQQGIVIISGLALGIDGVAHRGALAAGGTTLAVLGNGLHRIHPSSHQNLGKEIIARGGAIMTEYEMGEHALAHHFLERNRIVSGMADAVIVVEAAARSGTLSTAAHALEQGREVFAVPGNITSPMSAGCNALLKQGATPVTKTQDVLDVIAPRHAAPVQYALGDTEEEHIVLQLLRKGVRDGDTLQQKSALSASEFSQTMTMLEIKGSIKALGANQWGLK